MKIDFFNKTYKRKLAHILVSKLTNKNKYEQFKMVYESYFLNISDKNKFYMYYQKNIRVYLFFIKILSKKYENLRRLRFNNNLDLSLNTLRYSTTISLFHYDKLYKFNIFDLLKIIKNALYYYNELFMESQYPKNPYNNKEFMVGNFINIYLYMRSKYMTIPSYFEDFRRSGFCLKKYITINEPTIKLNCLQDYYKSMTKDELYGEIIIMLRSYKLKNVIIHPEFSKELIVQQFKSYINNYYIHSYSYHPLLRLEYKKKNKESIKTFFNKNPNFGCIIYNRKNPLMKQAETKYKYLNYLSEHIPDYNFFEDIENFNIKNENYLLNDDNNGADDNNDNNDADDTDNGTDNDADDTDNGTDNNADDTDNDADDTDDTDDEFLINIGLRNNNENR